jgi:hypothetical protein
LSISTRPAEQPKPTRPPRLEDDEDDDDDDRPRKRKRRKSLDSDPLLKDYYRHVAKPRPRSGPNIAISPAVITGVMMMIGAVVWFVAGWFLGWVFFYPPVLFILGLVAVVKGFMGYDED